MPSAKCHPTAPSSSAELLDRLGALTHTPLGKPWLEAALAAWKTCVPGPYHSLLLYSTALPVVRRPTHVFEEAMGWQNPDTPIARLLQETAHLHPIVAASEHQVRPSIYLRSELVAEQAWRRTEHFNEVDRSRNIQDMMVLVLPLQNSWRAMLTCGRDSRFPCSHRSIEHLPHIMAELYAARTHRPSPPGTHPMTAPRLAGARLTARENEIMRWVAEGKRNSEIAVILRLSPHTVRTHLEHIYTKFNVENRTTAKIAFESDEAAHRPLL